VSSAPAAVTTISATALSEYVGEPDLEGGGDERKLRRDNGRRFTGQGSHLYALQLRCLRYTVHWFNNTSPAVESYTMTGLLTATHLLPSVSGRR